MASGTDASRAGASQADGSRGAAGGDAGDAGPIAAPGDEHVCVPDEATFTYEIAPILESRCGGCHGVTPDFGAPFSLVDYDPLIDGMPGERRSDRMLDALTAGSMPPPGNRRPTPDEYRALTQWASCGDALLAYPAGMRSSRPVFEAPQVAPEGTRPIDLRADDALIRAGAIDHNEDLYFERIVSEPTFVRRIEVVLGDSRIVHHVALHYDDLLKTHLYAWAPGAGAMEFPEGGLRVDASTRFWINIHYNNLTDEDVIDSSGIRMSLGPPQGSEYVMLDPMTFEIELAPGSAGSAEMTCVARNDFTFFAGMPHMHELGDTFLHAVTRADTGVTETVIELSEWDFGVQLFYAVPMEIRAGDELTLRCTYHNTTDRTVVGGPGTSDEMCTHFVYATPATASLSCPSGYGLGRSLFVE